MQLFRVRGVRQFAESGETFPIRAADFLKQMIPSGKITGSLYEIFLKIAEKGEYGVIQVIFQKTVFNKTFVLLGELLAGIFDFFLGKQFVLRKIFFKQSEVYGRFTQRSERFPKISDLLLQLQGIMIRHFPEKTQQCAQTLEAPAQLMNLLVG